MKKELPLFNVVAYPDKEAVHTAYFKIASSLEPISTLYCLKQNQALLHATLCHFRANDDDQAYDLVRPLLSQEITVTPKGIYLMPDQEKDKTWIGHSLVRDPNLLCLRNDVCMLLCEKANNFKLNAADAYFPHFTLARILNANHIIIPKESLDDEMFNTHIPCTVRVGRSDEIGQLTRLLTPR